MQVSQAASGIDLLWQRRVGLYRHPSQFFGAMASVQTTSLQLSSDANVAHLQTDAGEEPLPPPTRNKRYFIEDEMTVFVVCFHIQQVFQL